jgi:thiamine-phosphate pyrophosphorylase
VIQVREPDLAAADLAALVDACLHAARGSGTRVVVNDRLDVALACGAAGVHLRERSMPPQAVRTLTPPGFVVGRSVHDPEAAGRAAPFVDYLIAGTVWPSASKPPGAPLLGVDGLSAVAAAVRVPVLAIGGVTEQRAAAAAAAGAAGCAAIGLFIGEGTGPDRCGAVPLAARVARLRALFDTSGSPS